MPTFDLNPELPITERRDDLVAALTASQVVVVAGETGSGKSTQLPKLCLDLGRGDHGARIAHTQPRRIAARSVAQRVADEVGVELGTLVGYTVRFGRHAGADTRLELMTDGILLAEIQHDRLLRRYDTLIIDEAHERSLNIDFLLGYVTTLLPKRPDLKVIVTSATIDTARFAAHFGAALGVEVPVVEVEGRTFPVEVRYRPPDDGDLVQGIVDGVRELCVSGPGDVLVFLSGEREIRDAAEALERAVGDDVEILPLFARLSSAEQQRVFAPHRGRRVVLATNVAETSLTVPGIIGVVDPGTARISRYNRRTKVQRLPIEAISQASADQRAGRCGRVAPGICIRLYDADDFAARPEFTEPEILRTNLASVILQMKAARLGDIETFPFVEPPDRRGIRDGLAVLEELGALDDDRLTKLGRRLARFPVDPRLARMILAAEQHDVVDEVIVVAAALSIQDPRERPRDRPEQATQSHARFTHPDADPASLLNLWRYLWDERRARSSSQFRKLCRTEFLHFQRIREWQDLVSQLRNVARDLDVTSSHRANEPAEIDVAAVTKALLPGLLSHVGLRDDERRDYAGARGARFVISGSSALAKKSPRWVVATELVETNRLWAHGVAKLQPEWIESAAAHLISTSYGEPAWDPDRGNAFASVRVSLFGLPLVSNRRVPYARLDPDGARAIFLRCALVGGDWTTHHEFAARNAAAIADVVDLEARSRRALLATDDQLFEFFDARVPATVVSGSTFDKWWKAERRSNPTLLDLDDGALFHSAGLDPSLYPTEWVQGDVSLPLRYGSLDDGVVVDVPVSVLGQVVDRGFDWHVPGVRAELVTALLRTLPKPIRRELVPLPDRTAAFLAAHGPADGPLLETLARFVGASVHDFSPGSLSTHLHVDFRVVGDSGDELGTGPSLARLRDALQREVRSSASRGGGLGVEATGLTAFPASPIPLSIDVESGGVVVPVYPALVDEGETVGVAVFPSAAEAAAAHRAGTRRLLLSSISSPVKRVRVALTETAGLALRAAPEGVLADCVAACVDAALTELGGPVRDAAAFAALRDAVAGRLDGLARRTGAAVGEVLVRAHRVQLLLDSLTAPGYQAAAADVAGQLGGLVHPGFVTKTGVDRLGDLTRYLEAAALRLEKLPKSPARDRELMQRMAVLDSEFLDALRRNPTAEVAEVRWLLEELRVSLFAQQLGTRGSVSETRIRKALVAATTSIA